MCHGQSTLTCCLQYLLVAIIALTVVHSSQKVQTCQGFLEHFVSHHYNNRNNNNNNNLDDNDTKTKPNEARVDLLQVVKKQPDAQLNIQLVIGSEDVGFLSAKDMIVELHNGKADAGTHVPLPGADGYYESASSGHRDLDVISKGRYINTKGQQLIDCQRGCWELCWLKDKPSGSLVLGFHIPIDYWRNDAILPCGDLWLSFPVWTERGLQYGQYEKEKTQSEIKVLLEKRDEELNKFDHSRNPIMRAIYLKNAFEYAEKCSELDDGVLDTIPEDDQVEKLQDDLLLSRYGMIWRRHGEGHVLLGHAVATKIDTWSPTGTSSSSLSPPNTDLRNLRP